MPVQVTMNSDGTSFRWSSSAARRMADCIHNEVKDMIAHSRLCRKSDGIALVQREDLEIGELLGRGAFSEVHSVQIRRGRNTTTSCTAADDDNNRIKSSSNNNNNNATTLPNNNNSTSSNNQKYAMKHLKFKLMSQPENFRLAAAELAVEAHMLASFDHPNILKIRGWAANGVASFTEGGHDSFFLLLDSLDETLDVRINRWQLDMEQLQLAAISQQQQQQRQQQQQQQQQRHPQSSRHHSGGSFFDVWRRFAHMPDEHEHHQQHHLQQQQQQQQQLLDSIMSDPALQRLYLEKLNVCVEIASALSYLHEHGVIFRDLKPNNIGFLNGRVQLFDFGLSRELPYHGGACGGGCDLTQPFEMSGKVGTLRYMAVEVACHQPYNVAADVYSWAMVCYEVLTAEKPFGGWTRDMHASLVCGRGARPELDSPFIPTNMRHLLQVSWSQQAHLRPPMDAIVQRVRMLEEQHLLLLVQQHQTEQQQQQQQAAAAALYNVQQHLHHHDPQQQQQQQAAAAVAVFAAAAASTAAHSSNVTVELPKDFMAGNDNDPRKCPGRVHSETLTSATMSMSTESLSDEWLIAQAAASSSSSQSHHHHQQHQHQQYQQQQQHAAVYHHHFSS
jgi:serine/threonine protein kinase